MPRKSATELDQSAHKKTHTTIKEMSPQIRIEKPTKGASISNEPIPRKLRNSYPKAKSRRSLGSQASEEEEEEEEETQRVKECFWDWAL